MPTSELADSVKSTVPTYRATKAEVISWIVYHFANAGYTAVVVAAIFNAYFVETVCGSGMPKGTPTLLWTLAVGLANFMVVTSAPLLGTICDYSAAKKMVLVASTIGCTILTSLLYFVGPGSVTLGFVLVAFSYFMFSTGENVLASFLPEVADVSTYGKISGLGCMVSHLGGLAVLGLCLGYVNWAQAHGQVAAQYVPVTALFVAVNFALFSIPLMLFLKEKASHHTLPKGKTHWQVGIERIQNTVAQAPKFRDLFRLLATIFCYTCGTSTVVVLAGVYAKQVMGFTFPETIMMFIVINLTATASAYVFGWINDKLGSKPTLILTLLTWIGSALVLALAQDKTVFWIAANLVGIANGASFTVGRAMIGQFAPRGRAGEFFGLWGLAGKSAAIVGPISYGLVTSLTSNNHRLAIMCPAVYFAIALVILFTINEQRGRLAATSDEA